MSACVHARVCMRACVRVGIRACVCAGARMRLWAGLIELCGNKELCPCVCKYRFYG